MSSKVRSPVLACVVAVLIVGGVTACGSSGSSGDRVVGQVDGTTITQAEVSHWMGTLVGGSYNELSHGHKVPAGLVSDPPDYSKCVASLEAASANVQAGSRPSGASLLEKCTQINQKFKEEATAYLVKLRWIIATARHLGMNVSSGEVTQLLQKIENEPQPYGGTFQQFLASTRRSPAAERFVVEVDVYRRKLSQLEKKEGLRGLDKIAEAGREVTAKTSCQPGYIVQHCKQYTGQTTVPPTPSGAVLMEQVATLIGRPCVNRAACG